MDRALYCRHSQGEYRKYDRKCKNETFLPANYPKKHVILLLNVRSVKLITSHPSAINPLNKRQIFYAQSSRWLMRRFQCLNSHIAV